MRKLATAALFFSAAILLSTYLLPYNWLLFCCAAAAVVSVIGFLFRGNMRKRIFIALLSLAIGFGWSWAYTAMFIAPSSILQDDAASVTAVVSGYPYARIRGYRVDVSIRQEGKPSIGSRIYYYDEVSLSPGDIIEFTARFKRTDGTEDEERIDALSARGAFLAGYVSGGISVTGKEDGLVYLPKRLADTVADMLDRLYDDDVSPFMQAFVVGKRNELDQDAALNAALSASGIAHIVSISGMHISFLMGFLALVVKNKRLFAMVGIPVLFVFMAMTGFTPSVTRAGMMQVFLISAPIFKRESDSLTSLSASLIVLLTANPYSCASVGLQLSFAATLGIILFTVRINSAVSDMMRGKKVNKNKIAKPVINFLTTTMATTVGALVFTLPLTAIHFGYVSLIAPVTNLLTLLAVSIAFPVGLVACIAGFIYFPLGVVVAYPVTWAVRYIIAVARAMASIPYASIYASNAHIMFWLAYVYAMFITLPLLKARARQYLLPACIAVIALCAVLLVSSLLPGTGASSLSVLDVGQGMSVVISSGEHTAVVDCGSSSGENAGAVAHEFLQTRGQTSVDLVVLTHFHADHINGIEYLLSSVSVSALAIPDPEGSFIAEDIIELARRRGTDIIYVTQTLSVELGGIELVLYPPVGFGDENERGLSVLCYGEISALITGDMKSSGERSLIRFAELPDIDILVVGHHGSRFSTSEELIAAVMPEIAIISVGHNSYGHPADDTLKRLDESLITVYRTDEMGHVTVTGG